MFWLFPQLPHDDCALCVLPVSRANGIPGTNLAGRYAHLQGISAGPARLYTKVATDTETFRDLVNPQDRASQANLISMYISASSCLSRICCFDISEMYISVYSVLFLSKSTVLDWQYYFGFVSPP